MNDRISKVTITDIARELNITAATVSRALNDHPGIRESTKKPVKDMATQLNYRHNKIASSLRSGKSGIIGVIIPSARINFFGSLVHGIEKIANENRYTVLIYQSNELYEYEKKGVQTFLQSQVDAVLASISKETINLDHYSEIRNKGIPLILFDRTNDRLGVSSVEVDDFAGAFQATKHLIDQGCRRIAHIAGQQHVNIFNLRLKGYIEALNVHGIPLDDDLIVHGKVSVDSGRECMKNMLLLLLACLSFLPGFTQTQVDLQGFTAQASSRVFVRDRLLTINWPAGSRTVGQLVINLRKELPLFSSLGLLEGTQYSKSLQQADPAFMLSVGRRDLVSQNGWNIFFDKVPSRPYQRYPITIHRKKITVISRGSRILVHIDSLDGTDFKGYLEITIYQGAPLLNMAAVLSTNRDSTAILYDAGLVSSTKIWDSVAWYDIHGQVSKQAVLPEDSSHNQEVKYRAIAGENTQGSIAVFPAPHQYFYPLDEAFNLRFTWYGRYVADKPWPYGIGIRQDLNGDHRYVPWFNAPPGTWQRLNFFCLLGKGDPVATLNQVKAYTHGDGYLPLKGYKTFSSHFHNEFTIKVVLSGQSVPDTPSFVAYFRKAGIDIVHLAEFHGVGHPKGPAPQRLQELKALFTQCRRLSDDHFLLLPGEEPNEFFGGHWLALFPKPVFWIMSRTKDEPFEVMDSLLGSVYRIGNSAEMMEMLRQEQGLVWTAHPRTKGSTGYPDKYRKEPFFLSDRFLGAAWKALPADLSQPRLGRRALDLMDDMNNQGLKKRMIAEADLFTIEPENEMYAHMNVNYLRLDKLPEFDKGWGNILDTLQRGRFFSTTGEVLIPTFTVNDISSGETALLPATGKALISFDATWTFPLNFAEIISGDGHTTYRHRIKLEQTIPFGKRHWRIPLDLSGRKWVRLEIWDVAANGAFTQTIELQQQKPTPPHRYNHSWFL